MATSVPHTGFELFDTGAMPSEALAQSASTITTSPTTTATFVTRIATLAPTTTNTDIVATRSAVPRNGTQCITFEPGEVVISRTSFTVALALCIFVTTACLITLFAAGYRAHRRRRQTQQARAWGRRSIYNHRMSAVRKEVDYSYSTKYGGCLVHVPENPELGSGEVVEMGDQDRLFEAPAVPAKATVAGGHLDRAKRKSRFKSLFFDEKVGVWVPRC